MDLFLASAIHPLQPSASPVSFSLRSHPQHTPTPPSPEIPRHNYRLLAPVVQPLDLRLFYRSKILAFSLRAPVDITEVDDSLAFAKDRGFNKPK